MTLLLPRTAPLTRRVRRAMAEVDRRDFLPADVRPFADWDEPLVIGHGATNSQPSTVAYMLHLLDVRPGMRVLDLGSGSGWTTEILARLTGESGSVLGLEIVADLVAMGSANLRSPWARIRQASPGVRGDPAGSYDRILVSADPGEIPSELAGQLAGGGRLVTPADGRMWVLTRLRDGLSVHRAPGLFRFVPLR